jgi:condensin complex subunit 2
MLKGFNFFGNNEVDFDFVLRKIDDDDDGDDDDNINNNNYRFNTDDGNGDNCNFSIAGEDDDDNDEEEDDVFLDQDFEADDERDEYQQQLSERDYVMAMSNNENELFSYFDSAFLRNWAGPEHWKLKRVKKSKSQHIPFFDQILLFLFNFGIYF